MLNIKSLLSRIQTQGTHACPPAAVEEKKLTVDTAVDPLLDEFDGLLFQRRSGCLQDMASGPTIFGKRATRKKRPSAQTLNYLLHNSSIRTRSGSDEDVRFGYVASALSSTPIEIRKGAVVGANVDTRRPFRRENPPKRSG
ncbi:hypothetical protein F2981_18855 (plasmid) [Sinorhizobium meliloti]|nr:hypothetical protein [Sinorhizobium meliloti]